MDNETAAYIQRDFLSWTGGFSPSSDAEITVYIDYALPIQIDEREVRSLLREWQGTADSEEDFRP